MADDVKEDKPPLLGREEISLLITHVSAHWGLAVAVFLTGLFASIFEGVGLSLFVPLLDALQSGGESGAPRNGVLRWLTKLFEGSDPVSTTRFLAVLILGVITLRTVLMYLNRVVTILLSNRVMRDLRCRIFDSLLHVKFAFFEKNDGGRVVGAISMETSRAVEALKSLLSMFSVGILLATYLALLLLLSWRLALAAAVASILVSFAVKGLVESAKGRGARASKANRRFLGRLLEVIEGMQIVRVFGRQSDEYKRFQDESEEVARAWYKMQIVSEGVKPIYELVGAALLLLMLVGGLGISVDLSRLMLFAFVLIRIQPRLIEFNKHRVVIHSNSSAIRETAALISPADGKQPSGTERVDKMPGIIRFENVSYVYENSDRPALKDVSLDIEPGQFVALVGGSGAGKTTLIKLLMRFYDPTSGRILIGDSDLRNVDVDDWRRKIALVAQDNYIFNATITENIAYGRVDATEQEIIEAAKGADAHQFIMQMPNQYDTIVGERGTRLSGGQKQRLALARAMVRNPALFVLDEATNQLDALTEKAVQETLMRLRHRCTMIVIAHRLATIKHADKIVVMKGGEVVETGSYADLVSAGGLFRSLADAQILDMRETRGEVA